MNKNKIFLNIYLIYIKNFTLLKEFSSMRQSIFAIHNSDSMLLLTVLQLALRKVSSRTFSFISPAKAKLNKRGIKSFIWLKIKT